jgi:hypothetical protein
MQWGLGARYGSPNRLFAIARRQAIAVAEAGFARRSQSAGGAGPFEGPAYSDGKGEGPAL